MEKSKFMEAQIVFANRQMETDLSVSEVCRKMGIGDAGVSDIGVKVSSGAC